MVSDREQYHLNPKGYVNRLVKTLRSSRKPMYEVVDTRLFIDVRLSLKKTPAESRSVYSRKDFECAIFNHLFVSSETIQPAR